MCGCIEANNAIFDHKTTSHCVESQTAQCEDKTAPWPDTTLRTHVSWQWLCPILHLSDYEEAQIGLVTGVSPPAE